MDIRYIKSNISKSPQDGLVKFLYDLLLQDISDVDNYEARRYYKGERVYLEENGKHQIYKCIVDVSSNTFIRSEWEHVMEVYEGLDEKIYNIRVQEEVHVIDSLTTNSIQTKLEFFSDNPTVAMYVGKRRLVRDYDFRLNGNIISFINPMNIGDRVILEVREVLRGVSLDLSITLYDLDGVPYRVTITNNGELHIVKSVQSDGDMRHVNVVSGERSYTMLIDSSVYPPRLGLYENVEIYLLGTDNIQYRLAVKNEDVILEPDPSGLYDRHVIMGSDRKFYTLSLENNRVKVTKVNDSSLKPADFHIGMRTLDEKHEPVIVDINNGEIKIIPDSLVEVFNYVSFTSKDSGETVYLGIDDNLDLKMVDKYEEVDGTTSPLIDELYICDNDWKIYKIYHMMGELFYEEYAGDMRLYGKGFKLLTPEGNVVKIGIDELTEELNINRVVPTAKIGTFDSPIDGYVIKVEEEIKIVTINKETLKFEVLDTDDEFLFNEHYIQSKDGRIYKLSVVNNVVEFIECDLGSYDTRDIHVGNFIKANDIIYRFDIENGNVVIKPISTFTHRLKSTNGKIYQLDITGGYLNEEISFIEREDVGYGDMYLRDENDEVYRVIVNNNLSLQFEKVNQPIDINYDVASVIYSSQGWYSLSLVNNELKFTKIFDNLFEETKSYGNLIRKDMVLTSENKSNYSLHADGNGNVEVVPYVKPNDKGVIINSDNGHLFALGIYDKDLVSYKSMVSKNLSSNKVYLRDITTGNIHGLFVKNDVLYSEIEKNVKDDIQTSYVIYDLYKCKYKIQMMDDKLYTDIIPDESIESDLTYDLSLVLHYNNKYYGLGVINDNLVFKETTKGSSLAVDQIYLQDINSDTVYRLFTDGTTLYNEPVTKINDVVYTGYNIYDNLNNSRRIQIVDGYLTLL